jgi:hypothetical protein
MVRRIQILRQVYPSQLPICRTRLLQRTERKHERDEVGESDDGED